MLRHLHVRNLAVIEEASLDLDGGLSVVTGETGAGKSLVVDSLALLAGARASSDLIRAGADSLLVTGMFEPRGNRWRKTLEEGGIDCSEDDLIVRREVSRSGRNRVFLNDQPATLRLLVAIAPDLMRIHSQREELGLMQPDLQLSWLDRIGGDKGSRLLERSAEAFRDYSSVVEKLERLTTDDRARGERADLLRYQLAEIENAQITEGEDVELTQERDLLRHAEEIRIGADRALHQLVDDESSAAAQLARANSALAEFPRWDGEARDWLGELDELRIRVQELAATVRSRFDSVDASPQRLNAVEDRLAELQRLFRKYGEGSGEVLAYSARIAGELDELEVDEGRLDELRAEVADKLEVCVSLAKKLSSERQKWAAKLQRELLAHLAELALPRAAFEVRIEPALVAPGGEHASRGVEIDGQRLRIGARGFDEVTFMFAPNPGEPPAPLARIASGGELARLFLALQVVLADLGKRGGGKPPSVVFDEVDVGVGGAEAAAVGRKLGRLGEQGQVLAVTHLPQVASQAHQHLTVRKRVQGKRTSVEVETLRGETRVDELSRMLGGEEITELTRSHARELISKGGGE